LPAKPITRNEITSMSPEQVAEAFKSGRLDHLLKPPPKED
jgi:hypothetical protein